MMYNHMVELTQFQNSFKAQRLPQTLLVYFAKKAGEIYTSRGTIVYEKGDAIITGARGEQRPVKYKYFVQNYTPIAPLIMGQDGKYTSNPIEVVAIKVTNNCQVIINTGDILSGIAGDYILQYSNNDLSIIRSDIFERTYQIIT